MTETQATSNRMPIPNEDDDVYVIHPKTGALHILRPATSFPNDYVRAMIWAGRGSTPFTYCGRDATGWEWFTDYAQVDRSPCARCIGGQFNDD